MGLARHAPQICKANRLALRMQSHRAVLETELLLALAGRTEVMKKEKHAPFVMVTKEVLDGMASNVPRSTQRLYRIQTAI